ncbi:MAG: beta galactosidase jelly roll domain-containing protein [Bacteroidota bacterium]
MHKQNGSESRFGFWGLVFVFAVIIGGMSFTKFMGQKKVKRLSLKGTWHFSLGDRAEWSKPQHDDKQWEIVQVPASWESQGFTGYNGFAWYRKHFKLEDFFYDQDLVLDLGRIDDVDKVFVNGELIGSTGQFPPHYQTRHYEHRLYHISASLLNQHADNVIAIQVFDAEGEGGLMGEDVSLYVSEDYLLPEINLAGIWKFLPGDAPDKASTEDWKDIPVPGYWETSGFPELDGLAWYRRSFQIEADKAAQPMVLLLGKIDDIDETYLNGVKVGQTGVISDDGHHQWEDSWETQRAYFIPEGLLKTDSENILEVRVYDHHIDGGIYAGPVGLISEEKYRRISQKAQTNWWEW